MIKNLKLLRTEHKISQQALANVLGISQQSINKYENHDIEPDINTLILIADYFNTSVDYLIGHSNTNCRIEQCEPMELNKTEFKMLCNYRKLTKEKRDSIDKITELLLK